MQTALGILSRQVDLVEGEKWITCTRLKQGLNFATVWKTAEYLVPAKYNSENKIIASPKSL